MDSIYYQIVVFTIKMHSLCVQWCRFACSIVGTSLCQRCDIKCPWLQAIRQHFEKVRLCISLIMCEVNFHFNLNLVKSKTKWFCTIHVNIVSLSMFIISIAHNFRTSTQNCFLLHWHKFPYIGLSV